MKKIIRIASVLALAGAALLYVGCTKDYSGDILKLENQDKALEDKIDQGISDLTGKINSTKQDLLKAIEDNTGLINSLQDRVDNLGINDKADKSLVDQLIERVNGIDTGKADKTALDDLAGKKDLEDLTGRVGTNESTIATLVTDLGTLTTNVTNYLAVALAKFAKDSTDIAKLNSDIAKLLADNSDSLLVNTERIRREAADKAINERVDSLKGAHDKQIKDLTAKADSIETIVIKALQDRVDVLEDSMKVLLNTTIPVIKSDIQTLKDQVKALQAAVLGLQKKITAIEAVPQKEYQVQAFYLDTIAIVSYNLVYAVTPAEAAAAVKKEDVSLWIKNGIVGHTYANGADDSELIPDMEVKIDSVKGDSKSGLITIAATVEEAVQRQEAYSYRNGLFAALYYEGVGLDEAEEAVEYEIMSAFSEISVNPAGADLKKRGNYVVNYIGTSEHPDTLEYIPFNSDTTVVACPTDKIEFEYKVSPAKTSRLSAEELSVLIGKDVKFVRKDTVVEDTARFVVDAEKYTVKLDEDAEVNDSIAVVSYWSIQLDEDKPVLIKTGTDTLKSSYSVQVSKSVIKVDLGSKTGEWTWKHMIDSIAIADKDTAFVKVMLPAGSTADSVSTNAAWASISKDGKKVIINNEGTGFPWVKKDTTAVIEWKFENANAKYFYSYSYKLPKCIADLDVITGSDTICITAPVDTTFAVATKAALLAEATTRKIAIAAADTQAFFDAVRSQSNGKLLKYNSSDVTSSNSKVSTSSDEAIYKVDLLANGWGDYKIGNICKNVHGVNFTFIHTLKSMKPEAKLKANSVYVHDRAVQLIADKDKLTAASPEYKIVTTPLTHYFFVEDAVENLAVAFKTAVEEGPVIPASVTVDTEGILGAGVIDWDAYDSLAVTYKVLLKANNATGNWDIDSTEVTFRINDPVSPINPRPLVINHQSTERADSVFVLDAFKDLMCTALPASAWTPATKASLINASTHSITALGDALELYIVPAEKADWTLPNGEPLPAEIANLFEYNGVANAVVFKANQAVMVDVDIVVPVTVDYTGRAAKTIPVTVKVRQN